MAETFSTMQQRVNEITKRPELVAVTNNAIRMATLRAHHVDMFHRDQDNAVMTYVPNVSALFQDIAAVYTAAPLLRAPNILQMEDTLTLLPVETLEFVPDYKQLWDKDNETRSSVFTLYGEGIKLRGLTNTGRARLHYYKNPDVSTGSYSSWIANAHPEEVASWAAGIVWARTGNLEQAKVQQEMIVNPFKEMLVDSYIVGKI